jgi:hypothetical protein
MAEGGVHRLVDRRQLARFRHRRLCVVVAGTRRDPGRLRDISAAGATLDTNARPPLGEAVRLQHPEAGEIVARVSRHHGGGIGLSFELAPESVAFAIRAYAADMTEQPTD